MGPIAGTGPSLVGGKIYHDTHKLSKVRLMDHVCQRQ